MTLHDDDVLGWSWLFPPYRWHLDARALTRFARSDSTVRASVQKSVEDHELGYELMRRFAKVIVSRLQATRMQLLDVYHHADG